MTVWSWTVCAKAIFSDELPIALIMYCPAYKLMVLRCDNTVAESRTDFANDKNFIVTCVPTFNKFFLWLGWVHLFCIQI